MLLSRKNEQVLKILIKNRTDQNFVKRKNIQDQFSDSEQEITDQINYLDSIGLIKKMEGSAWFIIITPAGVQYFDNKKVGRNEWLAEHLYIPVIVSFVAGIATGLVTKWLF